MPKELQSTGKRQCEEGMMMHQHDGAQATTAQGKTKASTTLTPSRRNEKRDDREQAENATTNVLDRERARGHP